MDEETKKLNKRVLIAEDEKPIANVLQLKLQRSGFDADIANDGEEALKMVDENKYDILLLDLVMPVMDGFNVLDNLKKKGVKIPVIVLSNLGQDEDIERAKKLGAVDYFVKSDIAITDVVENVKKILNL